MKKPGKNVFKVGRFRIGFRWVELWVDNSKDGGSAWFAPDGEGEITKIIVGIKQEWGDAVGTLLHEAQEIAYCDHHAAWRRRGDYCTDSDRVVFILTHAEFNESTQRVGWFVSKAMPAFSAAYKKHHRKRSP